MVTVVLRGGLGNQMFQYAAGLSLARRNGVPLFLDATFLNDRFPRRQFTYRTYDLDIFSFASQFTALSKVSSAVPIPGFWLGLDIACYEAENLLGIKKFLKEKRAGTLDESVLWAGGSVALWGFWQAEEYFKPYVDEVRAAFRFRDALAGEASRLGEEILKTNSVSLHVRRGDYFLPNNAHLRSATDGDYYERAIRYIAERVANPHFFIFSDDIGWCREHIKPPFPLTYMDAASEGPKMSFHLQLMSLCKHNIIANSSFSWWGAWLNRNPEKIVVRPGRFL